VSDSGKSIGAQAASGALWSAIGFTCLSLCGYVIAVLLARGLGPAAYGVYGVVYSVLLASEQILRFGVPQALAKLIGGETRADKSELESSGVWLGLGVSFAGFALLWLAAPALTVWLNVPDGVFLFRIAILDIPFFGLYRVLLHILAGRRDFRITGAVTCVYALARAAGVAILFAIDELSIGGALIANVAASAIGALAFIPRTGLQAFRLKVGERAAILATALPITVADVGMQCLLGLDLWLLSVLGKSIPPEVRGEYVAAVSLARGPNVIAFVLVFVLVPLISRARGAGQHASAGKLVQGTMRLLIVLLLPACSLVAAEASDLMALFFGENYRGGAKYLAVLIFAQGLGFTVLSTLQAIVIGMGNVAVAWHRIYLALVGSFVLNLLLIPPFGALGAAVSSLLAYLAANALLGQFVWRQLGVLADGRQAMLAVAISAGVAGLAWLIPARGAGLLLELASLGLVALGLMWVTGLTGPGDVALLLGRSGKGAREGAASGDS
jgi:O-antigen/teichoic acid export membrane protein